MFLNGKRKGFANGSRWMGEIKGDLRWTASITSELYAESEGGWEAVAKEQLAEDQPADQALPAASDERGRMRDGARGAHRDGRGQGAARGRGGRAEQTLRKNEIAIGMRGALHYYRVLDPRQIAMKRLNNNDPSVCSWKRTQANQCRVTPRRRLPPRSRQNARHASSMISHDGDVRTMRPHLRLVRV